MRPHLVVVGALATIIGGLWAFIALIYSNDAENLGRELVFGLAVAAAGALIAFIAWEKP